MGSPRRKFDKEFKMEAVKMVVEDGMTKSEVGRRLGVCAATLGNWVKAFQADGVVAFPGKGRLKPPKCGKLRP